MGKFVRLRSDHADWAPLKGFSHTQLKINLLKMLGLYLYTLVIGHKSSNMFSLLNILTRPKELQNNRVEFDQANLLQLEMCPKDT